MTGTAVGRGTWHAARRGIGGAAAMLAVALMTAAAMLGLAGTALAHNVLVSSDPANGSTVDVAPVRVSFTFDQPIQNFDPALKVFGPNGNDFTTAAPTIAGSTISAPIAAGPAGAYRAVYRIVSADGHPVTGQIVFTLAASAAGSATGTAVPGGAGAVGSGAAASAASTSGAASGLGVWLWVIVAAAVAVVVAAIVIAVRKPRDAGPRA